MSRTIRLDQVRIASPCSRSWDSLSPIAVSSGDATGRDTIRHCDDCNLNVYNFANLTQAEGEDLIRRTEGRLCGVIYRRTDGTVITRDCPVGLAAVKRRARWMVAKVAAAVLFVFCLGAYAFAGRARDEHAGSTFITASLAGRPFAALKRWVNAPVQRQQMLMGDICISPPTAK